jgi:hypothetical protein
MSNFEILIITLSALAVVGVIALVLEKPPRGPRKRS